MGRADLPARWTLLEGQDFLRHLRGGKRLSRWAASLTTDEMFSEVMHPMCLPWWENTSIPEDVRWEIEEERNAGEYSCYTLLMLLFEAVSREASSSVAVRGPLKALKRTALTTRGCRRSPGHPRRLYAQLAT